VEDQNYTPNDYPLSPDQQGWKNYFLSALTILLALGISAGIGLYMYQNYFSEPAITLTAPEPKTFATPDEVSVERRNLPVTEIVTSTASSGLIAETEATYEPELREPESTLAGSQTPNLPANTPQPDNTPTVSFGQVAVTNVTTDATAEPVSYSGTVLGTDPALLTLVIATPDGITLRVMGTETTSYTINGRAIQFSDIEPDDNLDVTGTQRDGSTEVEATTIDIVGTSRLTPLLEI